MGSSAASASKSASPPHGRKLGIVGVSLTQARLPAGCETDLADVRDELELLMKTTGYLERAAFSWVTVAIRFGLKDDAEPEFARVNTKFGDLPLSIEMNVATLQGEPIATYRSAYRRAAARALLGACIRYKLGLESSNAFAPLAELQAPEAP